MATKDQKTLIKPIVALVSTTIASDTVTNGAVIDTKGFQSLTFSMQSGVIAAGVATPSLLESDDGGFGAPTAVIAEDILGDIATEATFADTDDNTVKWFGYRGDKRYVQLDITTSGTTTSTVLAAQAILGNPDFAPTSA